MIKVNDKVIEQEKFGDGTLKCDAPNIFYPYLEDNNNNIYKITWCYDNDAELFALWCLVQNIEQNDPNSKKILYMPYIPHARQDRNVSGRLFTLKYFSQIINAMNFFQVWVVDPHSDVSTALINRGHVDKLNDIHAKHFLWYKKDYDSDENTIQIMFPDNGAAKKYKGTVWGDSDPIIGYKHRNTEGTIDSYELHGLKPTTKKVIIIDDICSYGGTFVNAAKELRKQGVETIYLAINHCENNILKGKVFDIIDKVFTTDSICTIEHPKLYVENIWRKENV